MTQATAQRTGTKQGKKTQGQKTQGQKTQGQKRQGAKQGPDYLGHGSYTANMLKTWSGIASRMLARGHSQAVIDFIYATAICPKGHDDHLNQTAASAKFFPGVSSITAKCRVLNSTLDLAQQIFSGQTVDRYQEKWNEDHKRPEPTGTRPRLSNEEKARRICTRVITVEFRNANGVGSRGVLKAEVQEKLDRHLEKHLPAAMKKTIVEME